MEPQRMEPQNLPAVSIVLATYNHMAYLPQAIESILSQTFTNWELIIINDGSTDNTEEYLHSLSDSRIQVITLDSNQGFIYAYNLGFKSARGEFITFISSDNYYYPNFLQRLVDEFANDCSLYFVYSGFEWVNGKNEVLRVTQNQFVSPHALLVLGNPGLASFLFRRSILSEIGSLDNRIGIGADTDLWIRITTHYKTKCIPDILCRFLTDRGCVSFDAGEEEAQKSLKKLVYKHFLSRSVGNHALTIPLRVLFVVPNFLPESKAGVEVYTYNLAKKLIDYGVHVSVLYRDYRDQERKRKPEIIEDYYENIPVYRIASASPINLKTNLKDEEIDNLFISFLDSRMFDIIHFHHVMGLPMSLIDISSRCGYPTIITLHDFYYFCPLVFAVRKENRPYPYPCDRFIVDQCAKCLNQPSVPIELFASTHYLMAYRHEYARQLLTSADLVTAPSRYIEATYKDCFRGVAIDIKLKPFGIKCTTNDIHRYRSPFLVRFGFIGVVHPIKQVLELVTIFEELKQEGVNATLSIFGTCPDAEYEKEIRQASANCSYHLEGFHPNDLGRILSEIDILVLPSKNETYSFAAREAIAAGVPVIAMYTGALPEIIQDGINGWLCHNFFQFKNTMREIVKAPEYYFNFKCTPEQIPTIESDAKDWMLTYSHVIDDLRESREKFLATNG